MMRPKDGTPQIEWANYRGHWISVSIDDDENDTGADTLIHSAFDLPEFIVDAVKLWADSNFMYEMDLQDFLEKTFPGTTL